jgi:hypothetical protein
MALKYQKTMKKVMLKMEKQYLDRLYQKYLDDEVVDQGDFPL